MQNDNTTPTTSSSESGYPPVDVARDVELLKIFMDMKAALAFEKPDMECLEISAAEGIELLVGDLPDETLSAAYDLQYAAGELQQLEDERAGSEKTSTEIVALQSARDYLDHAYQRLMGRSMFEKPTQH